MDVGHRVEHGRFNPGIESREGGLAFAQASVDPVDQVTSGHVPDEQE